MRASDHKPRLLILIPDPASPTTEAGGILSDARQLLGRELDDRFLVRVVDTLTPAYPYPTVWKRLRGGVVRSFHTVRALIGWRPDLVVAFCSEGASYYEKSGLLMLAKICGARVYLCPRSGYQQTWLERSALARGWVAVTGKWIDGLLVQAESWKQVFEQHGVRPEALHVWYNAIDTSEWAPIAERRTPCERSRPFRFLFLAWASQYKGLMELIEAAEILNARGGPSFEVAVAGDGDYGRELLARKQAGSLAPNIHLLGWIVGSRRAEELRVADAVVLPTWAEGFPHVVLETMACALPIITTPVGALPEVVLNEETGLIVPVRSVADLVEAMDRLRRDPLLAHRMGLLGLRRVREKFDRRDGVARFIAILQGAV